MTILDDRLRYLLDPAGPWQIRYADSGFALRYRAIRLSGGLALAYQPDGVYGPAETLTLSRPGVDVSPVEVKTVAESLARVLGWSKLELDVWDDRFSSPVRRIYWTRPQRRNSLTVHQAVVYDRNEEEEWMSLGITTNQDEAAEWLRRDQQQYLLRGQVVSYQVALGGVRE